MIGIYKITSPSGKIYIGESINIERRFRYYKKLWNVKSQTRLYYSFLKYGPKNHQFEIIEECSEDKLVERETYWKDFYKVLEIPSLCCRYDGKGGKLTEEIKTKISNSSKGKSRNKGRVQSKEEREKRSQIRKGYKPTKNHIENMRKGMIGKNIVKIICLNDKKEFKSIKEASLYYNIGRESIGNILLGYANKTENGLIFKYL